MSELGEDALGRLANNGTCFGYDHPFEQSVCEAENLNVTNPPSIYTFVDHPQLWSPTLCYLLNVTLDNRVHIPGAMNYCISPLRGYDAFLFVGIALIAACLLFGKMSTVYVLVVGAILGILHYYVNMLQLGNSITQWLSVNPRDLFLYAFLPPLIVEQAIHIEFYMFRKMFMHSIMLAVVMVILTAIILTPLILFVLGFQNRGWTWVHGALFAAIIAPTDALAVSSILKKANGPAILTTILEGESLLNDATGITLFQVFEGILERNKNEYSYGIPTVWSVIPTIIVDIIKLSGIGFGIGLGFSIIALVILRWLRWRGAGLHIEAVYVLAMAYLTYYVTNAPAGGSGVIAVVTFGLFGNWMSMWGMTGSSVKTGEFKAIWEAISFAANGLVFFWAGVASLTYVIRTISQTPTDAMTFATIPLIYIFMLVIRTFCIGIFNPIFQLVGKALSVAEIAFTGWSGLRGAVSLILVSSLSAGGNYINLLDSELTVSESYAIEMRTIKSDMYLWTAWFVMLTLLVNGPCIAPLLSILKLNTVPEAARHVQATAKRIILDNTKEIIQKLRDGDEDDKLLSGADWEVIATYVDLSKDLKDFGNVENISELDNSLERKGDSGSVELDQDSFWSVMLVLGKALWHSFKRFIKHVFRTILCSCGSRDHESQDSEDSSSQKWAPSDESTPAFETMLSECPFQSENTIGERNSGIEIQQSDDIETGASKDGSMQKAMPSHRHTSDGGIDESESDLDQVCLAGSRIHDLQKDFREARETQRPEREAGAHGVFSPDDPPLSPVNFQGAQLRGERTTSLRLGQDQIDERLDDNYNPDIHLEYKELAQYLADVSNSSEDTSTAVRDAHRHGSIEQRTLSNITGDKYRVEISDQMTKRKAPDSRKVDLFGRVLTDTGKGSNSQALDRAQDHNAGPTVLSHTLRGNPHAHGGNDGPSKEFLATLKGPDDLINRLRTISDMSEMTESLDGLEEESNAGRDVDSKAPDAGMRQAGTVYGLRLNTLQEIRSRITEGLKTRFHESRNVGNISDEAFRILVGACDEKMEIASQTKIGVWDILLKKIHRSFMTRVIAFIAIRGSVKFKSANPIVKKILHYPYALSSIFYRRYLGRKVLLACEVAIEYNLALNSSSHVHWLRLHGEYTLPLLEEVELESQRACNFIIEREIEAPDTFRAIQSYRGGIVVMKKMLDFIHEIHAQGIIDHGECEFVSEKVSTKLQRLEVVGPIWRPPRYKDGIQSLKPFVTLDKEIFKDLWDTGTIRECKPGEIIFDGDDMSTNQRQGLTYILHGVAKKQRRLNSVVREEFVGPESCIGVLPALGLASLRGTEKLVAVGSVLGRGPAIFHISQDKIDEIMLRAEKGSRGFLHLVQGWIKVASLYVFEDLKPPITLEIVKHNTTIMRQKRAARNYENLRSPFAERSLHSKAPGKLEDEKKSIQLNRIFSEDFIGVDGALPGPYETPQESINFQKATNCVHRIGQRLKKSLDSAHVLYFDHGELIQQDCTMILLIGHLKTDQDKEKLLSNDSVMRAPAAIPWLTEIDTQMMWGEAKPASTCLPIRWSVVSKTALVVVYPNPRS